MDPGGDEHPPAPAEDEGAVVVADVEGLEERPGHGHREEEHEHEEEGGVELIIHQNKKMKQNQ